MVFINLFNRVYTVLIDIFVFSSTWVALKIGVEKIKSSKLIPWAEFNVGITSRFIYSYNSKISEAFLVLSFADSIIPLK